MCKQPLWRIALAVVLFLSPGLLFGYSPASDPDLLAWWACDEGGGSLVSDSSGNGHDGTFVNGDPSWVAGIRGSAVELVGPTLVEIPPLNVVLSEATFSGWINPNGSQPDGSSFVMIRPVATGFNVLGSQLAYHWNNASNSWSYQGGDMIADGEWTFAAVSIFPDRATFNVNGVEGSTNTVNHAPVTFGANLYLGGDGTATWVARRMNGALDDVAFFARALTHEELQQVMLGLTDPAKATEDAPADEATDVGRDLTLSWNAGETANTHTVYLGLNFDDVNNASLGDAAMVAPGLTDTTLDPGRLLFDQTYFWRVDEVNGAPDFTVFKGDVWSFTTEPFSIPVSDITATADSSFGLSVAENTINGAGLVDDLHGSDAATMWISGGVPATIEYAFDTAYKLHELWIWNSNQLIEAFVGFGGKDVTIEHSLDGENWTALDGAGPLAQAPGTDGYAHNNVIDFGGAVAQHVRIAINSVHGIAPQASLSAVRFFYIPVAAREPHPVDGGTAEFVNTTLSWRAGREAGSHDVVLSTDIAAIADGTATVVVTQESSYAPETLSYSETYYWQVTETNAVETPPLHAGPIWSFMTPEYLVIDDFESYADEEFLEIWASWVDGFDDPSNGALVGNGDEPEKSIVHEGGKSMPIHYDNSATPISAATRTFDPPMDWTEGSPTSLSLHIRGNAAGFLEDDQGNVTLSAAGADIWNTADEFRFAYRSLSGDGSIIARVHSHTEVHDWSKVGVMIRESATAQSAMFFLPNTGVNGVRPQGRTATFIAAENMPGGLDGVQETIARDQPVWLRIDRQGDNFSGFYSTEDSVTSWTPLPGNPWTIPMAQNVLIGLAATSHSSGNTVVAQMSDVSTTGNVSGEWVVEAIGVQQASNDGDAMYVTVTDRSGGSATVSYLGGDPTATLNTVFQHWIISLADLSGVSLSSVESVSIGVGTPGGAPSGAQGTAYVDLLQVGTPLP